MQCGKAQGRVMSRWQHEPSGAWPGLRESAREGFLKPRCFVQMRWLLSRVGRGDTVGTAGRGRLQSKGMKF